jgi:hypothetical protein
VQDGLALKIKRLFRKAVSFMGPVPRCLVRRLVFAEALPRRAYFGCSGRRAMIFVAIFVRKWSEFRADRSD